MVERESLRAPTPCATSCAAALAAELGQPLQLELRSRRARRTRPSRREAAERERRQRQAEAAIRNDPLVRELMTQFKTARIVPGSIKPI